MESDGAARAVEPATHVYVCSGAAVFGILAMGRSRRTKSGPPTVRGPGRKSRKQQEPVLPRRLQLKARLQSERGRMRTSSSKPQLFTLAHLSPVPRSRSEECIGREDTAESEAEGAETGFEASMGREGQGTEEGELCTLSSAVYTRSCMCLD